jgi:hypothetical protein
MAQGLHTLSGGQDVILVHPWFYTLPLNYYYNNRSEKTVVYGAKNKTDLEGLVKQYSNQKEMLIIVGNDKRDPSGEIDQWINSHAVLVEKHQELYLYRISNTIVPVKSG